MSCARTNRCARAVARGDCPKSAPRCIPWEPRVLRRGPSRCASTLSTAAAAARRRSNCRSSRPGPPRREPLQLHDVLSGRTLLALHNLELDAITLGQRLEALRLDRAVVHEAILLA